MLGNNEEPSTRLRAQEYGEVMRHRAAIMRDENTTSTRRNIKHFQVIAGCETSSRGSVKIDVWLTSEKRCHNSLIEVSISLKTDAHAGIVRIWRRASAIF